jgi:outer membrane protein assembly factor BamB
VLALDPIAGSERWRAQLQTGCSAAPSAGHGLVFQPIRGGVGVALSVSSGEEVFRVNDLYPVTASVAVSDLAYIADIGGTVTAVQPVSGEIVWQADAGGPLWSSPAVREGMLFVGHSGGEIVALDARTGTVTWRHDSDEALRASPIAVGSAVIVATMAGTVYSFDAHNGDVIDRVALEGAVSQAPVTDGRFVYIATDKGYITCFGKPDEQHATSD